MPFSMRLPNPQIVVPGNHDVPLHNLYRAFFHHSTNIVVTSLMTCGLLHEDEEIAVLGVNTARSWTIKGGRINEQQVAWLKERLCALEPDVVKIVVTHHPFDLPEGHEERNLVGRARMAMEALADCGADVFLAGHLHVSQTTHSARRYKIKGHSALVRSGRNGFVEVEGAVRKTRSTWCVWTDPTLPLSVSSGTRRTGILFSPRRNAFVTRRMAGSGSRWAKSSRLLGARASRPQ